MGGFFKKQTRGKKIQKKARKPGMVIVMTNEVKTPFLLLKVACAHFIAISGETQPLSKLGC